MEDATVVSMKGRKIDQEMIESVKKNHKINGSIMMYFAYYLKRSVLNQIEKEDKPVDWTLSL
jgi:hypothetical protein